MSSVPVLMQGSVALAFIEAQGWQWKTVDSSNIELETCPLCHKTGYSHFYMEIRGTESEHKNRDSLFQCHRCGKSGNLISLKRELGINTSVKETGAAKAKDGLPDVDACHNALLNDEDALEYLLVVRGFSLDIIQRQKLGLTTQRFKEIGEAKALVFPYLINGQAIWAKYRTLPPNPKAFSSPHGYDTVLYNGECIKAGIEDITIVEGECDSLAALDKGITNIVGLSGAQNRKAEWISELDRLDIQKVYICLDNDKVGQKAANELASRIGIEKCYKLAVPAGKDLNEWFKDYGGTLEAFETLKANAKQFDVDGVASTEDSVQEFIDDLKDKGSIEPRYKTQWPSLNSIVGFDTGDVTDILGVEKSGKSTWALNIIEHMVDAYGEDGLFCCLEMTRAKMARKWIAMMAGIADTIPKTPEESKALLEAFENAIPLVQEKATNRAGRLYFCYPQYKSVDDIYKLLKDCIRRYGVKWIVLDNLQRLCDTTLGSKNRTQHLSEISKVTSQIAKDHKVQMIRILQPHRVGEGRMVGTDNVDGSSQIAKDCDCMITIHRDRIQEGSLEEFQAVGYVQGEGTCSNKMKVTVGLSRYSAGGYTTLNYDGARSTVTEFNLAAIGSMVAQANKNVGYDNVLRNLNIKKPAVQEVSEEITL